jgi:hypothetical protein
MVKNGRFGHGIWKDICGGNLNFIQMYDFGTFGLKISAGQIRAQLHFRRRRPITD